MEGDRERERERERDKEIERRGNYRLGEGETNGKYILLLYMEMLKGRVLYFQH
jgi:hypothetical protein